MGEMIGYIAVCVLQFILYTIYIKEILGLKRSWKWMPLCAIMAESICYCNEIFNNNAVMNSVMSFCMFLAVSIFFAKGTLKKKAIITITYIVLSSSVEILVVGVLSATNVIDISDIAINTSMRNILLLIVQIIILLGIQIPIHFLKGNVNDEIIGRQSGLVFLNSCMCFCASMVYGVYMIRAKGLSMGQIAVMCVLVLLNFVSYYFYSISMDNNKLRIEKEVYRKQAELYTEWYESIKSAREETRSLRHDMNNHISVLKSVAESEHSSETKLEKIGEYIEGLNFYPKIEHSADSGNILIDAMLDMKKSYAEAQDIEVVQDIKLPSGLNFNEQEFVIVFGNLMDNAIEGCLQNGGRVQNKICVRMKYDNGNFRMLIKNTYDGTLDGQTGNIKNNLFIESSKRDKKRHGIGLTNVARVVERYHGDVVWTAKAREFTVNLLMFKFAER